MIHPTNETQYNKSEMQKSALYTIRTRIIIINGYISKKYNNQWPRRMIYRLRNNVEVRDAEIQPDQLCC